MAEKSLESVLDAVRKLPLEEQRRLAEQIMKETSKAKTTSSLTGRALEAVEKATSNETLRALEAVEKTRGSMKGLDRETIIWLAEDEELCGY